MKKIHLVMPMGGSGTRFGNRDFCLPKPLIELQGKPFFYWAVQSVKKFFDIEDLIFVVLQEHVEKFAIDSSIREFYPESKIVIIPHVLNGAVLTCVESLVEIHDDNPILFNDCDHAFISNEFYDFARKGEFETVDGALLTFKSDNANYSYVLFDDNRKVKGTIEKVVASDSAICGAYYFKNRTIFLDGVNKYLEACSYTEYFVSGVYDVLVGNGCNVITFNLDEHISYGTPDEYDEAMRDERLLKLI